MPKPNGLLLLSGVLLAAPGRAEFLERIVAKVNGDIITLSEFQARQVAAVQAARLEPDRISVFLRENNAHILQEAIDDLLLYQRAGDLGLKLRPEYLKEVVDGIKKENNIASDEQLQEQLRREGMTLDDLKRNIERSILRRQILSRELEPRLTVSDGDAQKDYDARKSEYTTPPAVHLQEIVVKAEGSQPALARARDLVTRAQAGEDFAYLAKAHSGASSASAGGDLGWVARGEMSAAIEKAASALAPGQVSDPLPAGEGFRILKLVEKREGSVTAFEEVKAAIKQRLGEERGTKEYEAYVEGLRQKATIHTMVREVPLNVAVPATASPLADPAAPQAGRPDPDAEITISPQAAPEHVAPAPPPGEGDAEKKKEDKPARP